MLLDAQSIPKGSVLKADLCLVGGGAAGITIARELARRHRLQVCFLESGGLEFETDTQSLYKGKIVGLPYRPLEGSRLRYFGGTTNHWTGMCRPLDEIDFEKRDWIPHSGWPFGKSTLDPFYRRAHEVCELKDSNYEGGSLGPSPSLPPILFQTEWFKTTFFQYSPPTRFGEVYREEIRSAPNIRLYLHANLLEIETNETGRAVTGLRAASLKKNEFRVVAKYYVLALGAIENARILLLSHRVQKNGLGNRNDLVGRFFMDHPVLFSGLFLPSIPTEQLSFYEETQSVQGTKILGVTALTAQLIRREKLLNYSAYFYPLGKIDEVYRVSRGVESFQHLQHRIKTGRYSNKLARDEQKFWPHLRNVISEIDTVGKYVYSVYVKPKKNSVYTLVNRLEQSPNPASRVRLGSERDAFGQRRIELDWRTHPRDRETMRRAQEFLAREVGRLRLGRIQLDGYQEGTSESYGMYHHMGTTRMHTDPKQGVADSNGRVHEMENLFIAGASLFPTSGYVNPTLTLVALALRQADHLKGLFP